MLGLEVHQLHNEQVYPADLNCHNLMLDASGKPWIVDFDKCEFRAGEKWKQTNLERRLRSLRKVATDAGAVTCVGWLISAAGPLPTHSEISCRAARPSAPGMG